MGLSPKERILATVDGRAADYTPCTTFLFTELQGRCASPEAYYLQLLEMGLDPIVALPDPVWRFHPDVTEEVRRERTAGRDLLHKVYRTPAGDLTTTVEVTDDWPHGDRVPLMSDFVIPRATKPLVTSPADLEPLSWLLRAPDAAAVETFRAEASRMQRFADEHRLPTRGAFNRLSDMICWLSGCEAFSTWGVTEPALFQALIDLVAAWQERLIEVFLDVRPDILVDAQWYATTFLSPRLYEQFLSPALARRAAMAHAAGARFCALATTTVTPFFGLLKRIGVDMLFGVDPVQGAWDLRRTKAELGDTVCLCGGVNAYLTVVDGTPGAVRREVESSMAALSPGGRFILSPVDNIRIDDPAGGDAAWRRVQENVRAMVQAWKRLR
ncbi:MAG TPA: uroporphyrinogen decarboxylase family protein [Phycisphaerae bacterium]|nr:hypothetical protein [Phycisphaerae bacterium]HOI55414.1 uroporphyrinogen decarboxylase family protein [Phycisphaerae bacterium]